MLPDSIPVIVSRLQPTYLLSIVPAMPLAPCMATPRIQGIVHYQSVFQHCVVIGKVVRQAQRDRQQSGALRCQTETVGVRAAHDDGQISQRRIGQAVLLEKGIEAAFLAYVS